MRRLGGALEAVGRFVAWLVLGDKRFPASGCRPPRELAERRAADAQVASLRLSGNVGG